MLHLGTDKCVFAWITQQYVDNLQGKKKNKNSLM